MDWARSRKAREDRATAWESMKKYLDAASAENRSLTEDEVTAYDAHEADIERLDTEITRWDNAEKRSKVIDVTEAQVKEGYKPTGDNTDAGAGATGGQQEAEVRAMAAFRSYLTNGNAARYVEVLEEHPELRAHQASNDPEGGYLIAPQVMAAGLVQAADDATFMRQLSHVESLTEAGSLGVPTLETDLNDADWTQEIVAVTEDNALRVGKRELKPEYISKLVKLSRPLVRKTRGGIETLVRDRMSYKFGITEEKAYLTGDGSQKPLGVFTASPQGISTARDMATDNTTSAITTDGLMNAKYNQKASYWPGSNWIFHRDAVREIRKLVDGNSQYVWAPGLQSGQPDMILDSPLKVSEYVPNTFTTGLYVGIYGNFDWYWIADVFGLEVQVLTELYATTNQIGYIGRRELDGMPVLEEAFTRVKLG